MVRCCFIEGSKLTKYKICFSGGQHLISRQSLVPKTDKFYFGGKTPGNINCRVSPHLKQLMHRMHKPPGCIKHSHIRKANRVKFDIYLTVQTYLLIPILSAETL